MNFEWGDGLNKMQISMFIMIGISYETGGFSFLCIQFKWGIFPFAIQLLTLAFRYTDSVS